MNAVIINPKLNIANISVAMLDGLYSLNDLHKASGGEVKHKPSNFMQNQETKDLIAEIESENSDDGILSSLKKVAFKVVKGGNVNSVKQGTYVCKELVYRYAMWISAKFTLMVIRAFDAMVSTVSITERITPEQQAELHKIVDERAQGERKIYAEMWGRHNRRFNIPRYSELLVMHFEDSKHYLRTMEINAKPTIQPPIDAVDNLQLLNADLSHRVMDYMWRLEKEIERLGGKVPEYPQFDNDTIVKAVVTRIIRRSRILLSLGAQDEPKLSLVSNDSWIVNDTNLVGIIGDNSGVDKKLLPGIIEAAAKRLNK